MQPYSGGGGSVDWDGSTVAAVAGGALFVLGVLGFLFLALLEYYQNYVSRDHRLSRLYRKEGTFIAALAAALCVLGAAIIAVLLLYELEQGFREEYRHRQGRQP